MKKAYIKSLAIILFAGSFSRASAQNNPEATEVWEPVPGIVRSGKISSNPPSDAVVLFDGNNLDKWISFNDTASAALWTVKDGVFTVRKSAGDIRTKESFGDFQLHIEWQVPENISGSSQARGNSGIFLASLPDGKGYELQVLDSYNNKTYVNGQAGSIYKQYAPLVNPARPPGSWNEYDIVWMAPKFNPDGSLKSPAYVTVFFNGVLVQNHAALKGTTEYKGQPSYQTPHGALPICLQAHNDPSEPVSYRNIWLRRL